ncbi:MAG TPA: hypothetical protein VML91_10910 [Burkholderiales bacterium]|nr:hypothetical protein [Burkholderiales bacterium]
MKRPTPRSVAPLELRVANAAIRRRDWRVARFALEVHFGRRNQFRGAIRPQHKRLSLALDALVILADAEEAA